MDLTNWTDFFFFLFIYINGTLRLFNLIIRVYKIFNFRYSKKFKGKTLLKISKKLSNRYNSERRVTSGQRINGDALGFFKMHLDLSRYDTFASRDMIVQRKRE